MAEYYLCNTYAIYYVTVNLIEVVIDTLYSTFRDSLIFEEFRYLLGQD